MISRYPKYKVLDYCLNPLHIKDADKDVVVPCGKCSGCKVYAANVWTQRLSAETDNCPYSLFVTATYNNKFLPKLVDVGVSQMRCWSSDHRDNWRFASSRCSLRDDNISIIGNFDPVAVTNFDDYPCVPYASKRDVQLYLKQIRKILSLKFDNGEYPYFFRYFVISEYGETKFRPHEHYIFFPYDEQIRDYLVEDVLFACWQMCDEDRFREFIKPCDSGSSNYLASYVNSISRIPSIYEDEQIRPFRLSSKSPALGFSAFDRKEIVKQVSVGVTEYVRSIKRLGSRFSFQYPKSYMFSVFPKCAEYSRKSYAELLCIYNSCYLSSRSGGEVKEFRCGQVLVTSDSSLRGLSFALRPSDYNASRVCLKICDECGITPIEYLDKLVMYHFKRDMYSLKLFYELQNCKSSSPLFIMSLYQNLGEYANKIITGSATNNEILAFDLFCESFSVDPLHVLYDHRDFALGTYIDSRYELELQDIMENMVKMPKFNEKLGLSPVNQFF